MRRLLVACLLVGACGTGATRSATVTAASLDLATPPTTFVVPDPAPTTTSSTTTTTAPQPTTTTTEPPRPPVTTASRSRGAPDWSALRQCESGGNYANKENPKYRGAYQFSYATWASVGGSGDPADASPDEQDTRAQILYDRSGAGQWPVCGRLL